MRLKEVLGDIAFDPGYDYEPLEDYLQTEVSTQYKVPYDSPPAGLPEVPRPVSERELFEELMQHLTDLGYFTEEEFNAVQGDANNLPLRFREGVRKYFDDDLELASHWPLPAVDETLGAFREFLPVLNQRLSVLTALDGEFDHELELKVGDSGLYPRLLHFRLHTYGVYNKSVSDPVSADSVVGAYLTILRCREITHEEFGAALNRGKVDRVLFNRLGNAFEIARSLGEKYHVHQLGFYFHATSDPVDAVLPFVFGHKGAIISGNDRRDFLRKLDKADARRRDWSANEPDETNAYDDQVVFARRMIQVLLWMTGYYQGRLDNVWGERTHQAMLDFIKLNGIEDRREMLQLLGGNLWAFNANGFLSRLILGQAEIPVPPSDGLEFEEPVMGFDEKKATMLEEMESGLAEEATVPGSDPDTTNERENDNMGFARRFFQRIKRLGRRIYYGARTLVLSAVKGLKDLWKFLRDEVIGPAANFFRHLFKQIREGIRTFFDSMRRFVHFLLRKPVISHDNNQLVVSKYDFDSDCLHYVSNPCGAALITTHRDLLAHLNNQLAVFMRIAGKVIGMILSLSTPLGWIGVALKIGRIVFEEIRRRMR